MPGTGAWGESAGPWTEQSPPRPRQGTCFSPPSTDLPAFVGLSFQWKRRKRSLSLHPTCRCGVQWPQRTEGRSQVAQPLRPPPPSSHDILIKITGRWIPSPPDPGDLILPNFICEDPISRESRILRFWGDVNLGAHVRHCSVRVRVAWGQCLCSFGGVGDGVLLRSPHVT